MHKTRGRHAETTGAHLSGKLGGETATDNSMPFEAPTPGERVPCAGRVWTLEQRLR